MSSIKMDKIAEGTRRPLPQGPLLDLPVVNQYLEPIMALFVERAAKEAWNVTMELSQLRAKVQALTTENEAFSYKLAKTTKEKDIAEARVVDKFGTITTQIRQINSLQEDLRKKDSNIKDLEDEVKEVKKLVATWEVKCDNQTFLYQGACNTSNPRQDMIDNSISKLTGPLNGIKTYIALAAKRQMRETSP
uniref:Uncharacterized protein n=1 Tax=Cannabis sativa TaxID=3483 RepID=A0A803QNS3_CANSA